MDFTRHEIEILENEGYSFISDDPSEMGVVRNHHANGDYETIVKTDKDEFDYYFDVNVDASDLDKANRNITQCGLTWEELALTIDFIGFC